MKLKKKLFYVLIALTFLYMIQFLIAPALFPEFYPQSNEAIIMFLSLMLFVEIIGMFIISDHLVHWLLGDLIYMMLMIIYHAEGAYGIGMVGMSLDGIQLRYNKVAALSTIPFILLILVMTQIIAKAIKKIVHWIKK